MTRQKNKEQKDLPGRAGLKKVLLELTASPAVAAELLWMIEESYNKGVQDGIVTVAEALTVMSTTYPVIPTAQFAKDVILIAKQFSSDTETVPASPPGTVVH